MGTQKPLPPIKSRRCWNCHSLIQDDPICAYCGATRTKVGRIRTVPALRDLRAWVGGNVYRALFLLFIPILGYVVASCAVGQNREYDKLYHIRCVSYGVVEIDDNYYGRAWGLLNVVRVGTGETVILPSHAVCTWELVAENMLTPVP